MFALYITALLYELIGDTNYIGGRQRDFFEWCILIFYPLYVPIWILTAVGFVVYDVIPKIRINKKWTVAGIKGLKNKKIQFICWKTIKREGGWSNDPTFSFTGISSNWFICGWVKDLR